MSELCRIKVNIDPNSTNPNRIGGRDRYAQRQIRQAAWMAARSAWINAGRPTTEKKVIVHLEVYRERVLDEGNIWAAMKSPIDGLFVRAITHDDSPKFLRLGLISQFTGRQYKGKESVVFIVEEI